MRNYIKDSLRLGLLPSIFVLCRFSFKSGKQNLPRLSFINLVICSCLVMSYTSSKIVYILVSMFVSRELMV